MQQFANTRSERDEYATQCRMAAEQAEAEALAHSARSAERCELLIEASHLLDRAAQALV